MIWIGTADIVGSSTPNPFVPVSPRLSLQIKFFAGYWLKPLSNQQIEELWTPSMLDAFMHLGERYPRYRWRDLCSSSGEVRSRKYVQEQRIGALCGGLSHLWPFRHVGFRSPASRVL